MASFWRGVVILAAGAWGLTVWAEPQATRTVLFPSGDYAPVRALDKPEPFQERSASDGTDPFRDSLPLDAPKRAYIPSSQAGETCAARCNAIRKQCRQHPTGTCSAAQNRIDEHCDNYTLAKDRDRCQAVNRSAHGCSSALSDATSCEQRWGQCLSNCH